METAVVILDWVFLTFFICLNGCYGTLLLFSLIDIILYARRRVEWQLDEALRSYYTIPVTIIAPAYNEEATIVDSVHSLLALKYAEYEVIVVNDGSKDNTLQTLMRSFDLYPIHPIYRRRLDTQDVVAVYRSRTEPRLTVVDKENGGKADALNCGVNFSKYPLLCSIDADTLIAPDALLKVVVPFMEDPDRTVAVGGTIRVANGCEIEGGNVKEVRLPRHPVALFQVVEYLRAFLFGRIGWNLLGGTLIISGAFGLFQREAVIEVGGYKHDTVGEDMELVVRMHRVLREKRRPYRVVFVWASFCYTEVPEDLAVLGRQRDRWHRGLMDVTKRHLRMFLNPRYGVVGMIVFPFFAIFEMLGPLIEVLGFIIVTLSFILGIVDVPFMFLFLTFALFLGILLSVATLVLEELSFGQFPDWKSLIKLAFFAILENFGYRQLTVFWRLRGMWNFLRGEKTWGVMTRKGFQGSS